MKNDLEKTRKKESGYRTLLTSVLLSSPGPLVLGLGLTVGRSSTQISDFVRRTAELMAILASFVVFCIIDKHKDYDEKKKASLARGSNTFVGIIMCISGLSMMILAFTSGNEDKGNVVPAMVISLSGAIVNSAFWSKYTNLYKKNGNTILGVQGRLYGAKSVVDICVTLSLFVVALFPNSAVSRYFDILGSVLVSLYMLWSGIKTIRQQLAENPASSL
jgi:divalent metal cation (Fe/Co/Zn/Cd) transporter